MPRGRQYYDPIVMAPGRVEGPAARRIELFPEGDVTDAPPGPLRWVARLIGDDGLIVQRSTGSFDHDDALRQAQELWPGLEVFELREESEDSTWEGMGPSPRLWQGGLSVGTTEAWAEHVADTPALPPAGEPATLHALTVSAPGTYVRVEDVLVCLEEYATQFDGDNPSAALGIRQAAAALREPF